MAKHSMRRGRRSAKRGGSLSALSPASIDAPVAAGPKLEDVKLNNTDQESVDWKKAVVDQGGFNEGVIKAQAGGRKSRRHSRKARRHSKKSRRHSKRAGRKSRRHSMRKHRR